MRRSPPLLATLAIGVVACVCAASGSAFSIDKTKTFLGGTFTHGEGTDGVHEAISAAAIRRGMPKAPQKLIGLIQAGAENVDVTHHFDAEYHFDSASTATFPKRFAKAFSTVHAHLRGAETLANRNPEFFDPSFATFRHIAGGLAAAVGGLAGHPRCSGCDEGKLRQRAKTIAGLRSTLLVNENPDVHQPTNPESAFSRASLTRTRLRGLREALARQHPLPVGRLERGVVIEARAHGGDRAPGERPAARTRPQHLPGAARLPRLPGDRPRVPRDPGLLRPHELRRADGGRRGGKPDPKGTVFPVPQQRSGFTLWRGSSA